MKGRDMALASLKNSVRARKGIGLANGSNSTRQLRPV